MKSIRFTRSATPYNPGDVATFRDDIADHYLRFGYASECRLEPAPKARRGDSASEPRFDHLNAMDDGSGSVIK